MECNTSCEPMDIDLSSTSVNAMEISYNEVFTSIPKDNSVEAVTRLSVSPSFKKLVVDLTAKNSNSRKSSTFYTLGVFFLLLSGVVYHISTGIKCQGDLNIDEIRNKLSYRLYGQTSAASKIVNTLKSHVKNKMLIMYGRTGVGKTLSVSLILEDIMTYNNVYHYTMPTFLDMFSTDILLGFTLCKNSIVVIDDLKSNDTLQIKDKVLNLLAKSERLNKNLIIILVYTCNTMEEPTLGECVTSLDTELKRSYADIDILKEYVEFNQLDNSILRKCIEYELGDRKISDELIEHIIKKFNVSQDGCKSVHQKIRYLNIL